jgi:hypothetical protein
LKKPRKRTRLSKRDLSQAISENEELEQALAAAKQDLISARREELFWREEQGTARSGERRLELAAQTHEVNA